MKVNESVPPLAKQNEDHDAPESPERRVFLEAVRNFGLGVAGAALVGVNADRAEARGRKKRRRSKVSKEQPIKKNAPEVAQDREGTPEQEQARKEYELRLAGTPLQNSSVHLERQGKSVKVSDLLSDELLGFKNGESFPLPDARTLFKNGTGLVIIPTFHRALLFKNGSLVHEPMPIGTAATSVGHRTPRGFFKVYRKEESEHFSSTAHPPQPGEEPNMAWATFFEKTGIATHGSNRFYIDEKTGEEMLKIDSSHGCINMRKEDALAVQETLDYLDEVLILDDVHYVVPESRSMLPGERVSDEDLALTPPIPERKINQSKSTGSPVKKRVFKAPPGEPTGL